MTDVKPEIFHCAACNKTGPRDAWSVNPRQGYLQCGCGRIPHKLADDVKPATDGTIRMLKNASANSTHSGLPCLTISVAMRDEVLARLEATEQEREQARGNYGDCCEHRNSLMAKLEASEARVRELEAALQPFAYFSQAWGGQSYLDDEKLIVDGKPIFSNPTLGHCRRAAYLLGQPLPAPPEVGEPVDRTG